MIISQFNSVITFVVMQNNAQSQADVI